MHEHVSDHWVQEAQRLGYRSRAAFKLLELAAKDGLFARAWAQSISGPRRGTGARCSASGSAPPPGSSRSTASPFSCRRRVSVGTATTRCWRRTRRFRPAVTAMALPVASAPPAPNPSAAATAPGYRRAARYAWARLVARIYEVFPLWCPLCGAQMRIVAFITDPTSVREILAHLGESIRPPIIAPARGPPLWEIPDRPSRTRLPFRPIPYWKRLAVAPLADFW